MESLAGGQLEWPGESGWTTVRESCPGWPDTVGVPVEETLGDAAYGERGDTRQGLRVIRRGRRTLQGCPWCRERARSGEWATCPPARMAREALPNAVLRSWRSLSRRAVAPVLPRDIAVTHTGTVPAYGKRTDGAGRVHPRPCRPSRFDGGW